MELLIPGLILVALMVWASTKIKKTAADAFQPEFIETEAYSLQKPEGFLHVIGDEEHEFMAYSRDFGKNDNTGIRQATIEIDFFRDSNLVAIRDAVTTSATRAEVTSEAATTCELNTKESANEIAVTAFYKIVSAESGIYRLRFAVLPEYFDNYLDKIKETLDGFLVRKI